MLCLPGLLLGRSPSPFCLGEQRQSASAGAWSAKAYHEDSIRLCNGALHTGTKPDYILCVPCAAYWAHLSHVTFKNEALSIRQLEAMAEKQPRSRKELSKLCTDKQLCLVSREARSLAVHSKGEAKVGVVAVHSL